MIGYDEPDYEGDAVIASAELTRKGERLGLFVLRWI